MKRPRATWRPHNPSADRNRQFRKRDNTRRQMKNKKPNNPKTSGTLRPWLVDVVIDSIR
jgi:hypothetical protein